MKFDVVEEEWWGEVGVDFGSWLSMCLTGEDDTDELLATRELVVVVVHVLLELVQDANGTVLPDAIRHLQRVDPHGEL